MNTENLGKLFARYTLPTVFAMLVSSTYQIADGIIIGHFIGTEGLAAMSLVWPWLSVPLGFGLLVGVGIGSVSSIARGAGEHQKADRALGQLAVWLFLPGLVMGSLLYFLSPWLLELQGASGLSAEYSIEYLRVIAVSCPLVIGSLAIPFLVRNLNAPQLATLFMIIGALLNILLAYLFAAHLHWGVRGVALATVISETLVGLMGLSYILSKRCPVRLSLKNCRPDADLAKQIAMNGVPSLLMYSYMGVVALLHHIMLLRYGNTEWVAAYAIIGYILTVYYLIVEGIANGMQPIVSYLHGARQPHAVRRILSMALWWGVGIGVAITLLLQIFPHFFVDIFADDSTVLQEKGAYALRLNLFVLFLEGFFVIVAAYLQSLNRGKSALYITLGNMLIQVPFLLLMPLWFGLLGIWLAMPVSSILLMAYVGLLLYREFRLPVPHAS